MYGSQKFDFYHNPVKMEDSRTRVSERLARFRHRRKVCNRYRISVAEYERRFAAWCYLRKLYADRLQSLKQRSDREAFNRMISARQKAKASFKVSRAAASDAAAILESVGPQIDGLPRLRAMFQTDQQTS